MSNTDLRYHQCDRADSWPEYDARGIYLCRVCDICYKAKLSQYRESVLVDPNYYADEPIEPE